MNVLSYIFLREIRQVDFSMHQQFGLYLPLGHLEHLGFADGSKSVVVLEPMRPPRLGLGSASKDFLHGTHLCGQGQ